MTGEIVIAEDEFANRDHGEFIEIVATPEGLRAWAEGEGGSVQKKCSATWAEVLKRVPDQEIFYEYNFRINNIKLEMMREEAARDERNERRNRDS